MSDKYETTDDIIREMRDLGALDAQCNDMIPRSLQALGLRTYAARLEAARKQESGNAAAMREALEFAEEELWAHGVFDSSKRVAAALSAPPRNCDRFQTASEVSAYWNSNVRTVPLPHDAYGMRIDGETYPTFLDWLMAPAKEGK